MANKKGRRDTIKKGIILVLSTLFLVFILEKWGLKYGLYSFFALCISLAGYKIITNWDEYIQSMRTIESMIWGRPLEKKFWNKGEKKPKIKLVWGKK